MLYALHFVFIYTLDSKTIDGTNLMKLLIGKQHERQQVSVDPHPHRDESDNRTVFDDPVIGICAATVRACSQFSIHCLLLATFDALLLS